MPGRDVYIVGVGMTNFEKPGKVKWDYPDMVKQAVTDALADANAMQYDRIEQVCVGYVYGDSTCGQRAVYEMGLTGVPVYNVNNNCATGSTALFMAKQFVEGGLAECCLAIGFEKMSPGPLAANWNDRTNPMDNHFKEMVELRGFAKAPPAPQMFGNAGREHMEKYGSTAEDMAAIALKNHRHSANNPKSQFKGTASSLDDVLGAPMVYAPLTKKQCCPTSEGAAAAVLCSHDFVVANGLQDQAVKIAGMALTTDTPSTFNEKSCIKMVGSDMTKAAAAKAFAQAGIRPTDVQVVELHDCFSANELITYEGLGLAEEGKGHLLVRNGDNTYGGKYVVNPSGGLESKGHPLGATGLAQAYELSLQVRGQAGPRQVPNVKYALQHNLGLGGAAVVGVLTKGFASGSSKL